MIVFINVIVLTISAIITIVNLLMALHDETQTNRWGYHGPIYNRIGHIVDQMDAEVYATSHHDAVVKITRIMESNHRDLCADHINARKVKKI